MVVESHVHVVAKIPVVQAENAAVGIQVAMAWVGRQGLGAVVNADGKGDGRLEVGALAHMEHAVEAVERAVAEAGSGAVTDERKLLGTGVAAQHAHKTKVAVMGPEGFVVHTEGVVWGAGGAGAGTGGLEVGSAGAVMSRVGSIQVCKDAVLGHLDPLRLQEPATEHETTVSQKKKKKPPLLGQLR